MEAKKVFVVFYSRSGHTKRVADGLARTLEAEIEALVDTRNRAGLVGYLKSGYEATFGRLTRLQPMVEDPAAYDLVVIGTPIWNAAVSSPVRTFLAQQRAKIRRAAFFCTYGGRGAERAFHQMAEASGKTPLATLAVKDAEIDGSGYGARSEAFGKQLETALGCVTA